MVNGYAWYTVSERHLCHSERSEESRGEEEEILRFALNDKRPNAEEHPPLPPLQRGECGSEALGKQANAFGGGLKA